MAMTTFLENELLDHWYTNSAATSPATVFAALYTVAPTVAGGGTEVVGSGYTRKLATFSESSQVDNSGTGGVGAEISNLVQISWTANSNWGIIVAVGIFDVITGGNLLFYHTDTVAFYPDLETFNVIKGRVYRFKVGELKINVA